MTDLKTSYVREHYNTEIENKYKGDYEFNRWFREKRTWMDFHMTYRSIAHHLKQVSFTKCFELGPGPGTWTRLLFRHNPEAQFSLLDISKEMMRQFYLEMRGKPNVQYSIGDFLETEVKEAAYDLFFSSRALEYLPDKEAAIDKISKLLVPGGVCMIVTKNPHMARIRKNSPAKHHRDQIAASDLKSLLERKGFQSVHVFPVIIRLPLIDRVSLCFAKKLFETRYMRSAESLTRFAESYIVICTKQS